jgi:TrmH family RNA methyltransferase
MISKNELKYYSSLLKKKFRESDKKFIVEGKKSVYEGIESDFNCEIVFVTNKFALEEIQFIKNLENKNFKVTVLKSVDFKKVSDTKTPQGIAAVFEIKNPELDLLSLDDPLLVYLENISDPGNLGTIIRTCDWFGIQNIFLSKESSEIFNSKVIRASMGSVFHINIFENVTLDEVAVLKKSGYEFLCGDMDGENVYDTIEGKHTLLFLANESRGPSEKLLSIIDKKITIPGKGKAESLNVASASAIILAELTK